MSDRPAKVLIADDNPQGVELLEAYLSDSGYEIKTAIDGDETLKLCQDWHPDVLLLDIMMPKLSGFEVCKRLKSSKETSDIVVLMVTALDQHSDIDRAVAAGTNDFMTKPIHKNELLLRVHSALQSRQAKGPLEQALNYMEGVQAK